MSYGKRGGWPQRAVVVAMLAVSTLSGCVSTATDGGRLVGGGIGSGLGALIGREAGGTGGMIIGAVIGGILGGYAGGEIARYLDEADREKAAETTAEALQQSHSRGGAEVAAEWVSEKNPGVSGSAAARGIGGNCYAVQEVAVIPGEGDVRQERQLCNRDGQWVEV